jgi:hypothetical protein
MTRNIRVRGIKRKQIDEDKLALAFLLLAKVIHEDNADGSSAASAGRDPGDAQNRNEPGAA